MGRTQGWWGVGPWVDSRAEPASGDPSGQPWRGLPTRWVLGFTLLCAGFFALSSSLWWKSLVFDILFLILFGLPIWDGWKRGDREPESRWAWRFLALATISAALGTLRYLLALFTHGVMVNAPPRKVFVLWMTATVLTFVGVYLFPRAGQGKGLRRRAIMDSLISALAYFLLIWSWFLETLVAKSTLPWLDEAMVVAFFVTVAGNLGLVANLVSAKRAAWRGPLGALTGLCLGLVLLMPPWVEAILTNTYHQAHVARLILLPAWVSYFLAFRAPWPRQDEEQAGPRSALQDLLPYIPVLLATGIVGFTYLWGGAMGHRTGLALFLVLAVLVLLRQMVALQDVRDLSHDLEGKVELRTRDLAASQNLILQTQRMNLVASLGAGLVHDANNLIGAAKSYVQLIQYSLDDGQPVEPEDLEKMDSALTKAGDMLRQLMDFARTGESSSEALNINRQVLGLEPLLRIVIPKGLHLNVELHPGSLLVQADPAKIDQVIVNLVGNARDATPAGGSITIRTHPLRGDSLPAAPAGDPHSQPGRTWVDLVVEDSGSGMPPEVVARIFDAFFTTKPPGKGTGLGLSSVKAVVEGLGGTLEVESEVGRGTAIHVLLPEARA